MLLGNLPLTITGFCNLELRETDVFWTPSEWAWVATLFNVVFPGLFYGRPIVAYTADDKFRPKIAMEIIERYDVSIFFTPPTALRMMEQITVTDSWDVSRSVSFQAVASHLDSRSLTGQRRSSRGPQFTKHTDRRRQT